MRAVSSAECALRASRFATGGFRAGAEQLADDPLDPQRRGRPRTVHEPDPERRFGVEPLAGDEVAARAGADPRDHERRDDGGDDPELDLAEPEHGVVRRDRHVAAGKETAARRRAHGRARARPPAPGSVASIASSSARRRSASSTFSSNERSTEERIQAMSAPAQNDGPSPASTTARASPDARNASVSSEINAGSSAFRRSGRASVTCTSGPSRSTRTELTPVEPTGRPGH